MAFDIGAGLSTAGTAVAASAGAQILESQKAELEMEKVKLADQLAGAREEKQRGFLTSERVATQAFTGEENTKTRTNALDIAKMQTDATVKAAGMQAGATMGAAAMNSQASRDNLAATLAQNKPLIDVEVLGKTIANNNATQLASAKDDLVKARESNDPDKIKAAIQKEADLTLGADKNIQVVAQYQAAQKMALTLYTELNGKVATLTASPMASSPEVKAQIDLFTKAAQRALGEYNSAKTMSEQAQAQLPVGMPPQAGAAPGGTVNAGQFYKPPAVAAPPITGQPAAPAPALPQGYTINGFQ